MTLYVKCDKRKRKILLGYCKRCKGPDGKFLGLLKNNKGIYCGTLGFKGKIRDIDIVKIINGRRRKRAGSTKDKKQE